ncbi:hypothetical protein GGR57DRAFT_324070 [Xylariaceae sp. FL1272]|nr:hypothetical protein GGR57DRAFT_324070 [Xylariaceae sp. FL1272]
MPPFFASRMPPPDQSQLPPICQPSDSNGNGDASRICVGCFVPQPPNKFYCYHRGLSLKCQDCLQLQQVMREQKKREKNEPKKKEQPKTPSYAFRYYHERPSAKQSSSKQSASSRPNPLVISDEQPQQPPSYDPSIVMAATALAAQLLASPASSATMAADSPRNEWEGPDLNVDWDIPPDAETNGVKNADQPVDWDALLNVTPTWTSPPDPEVERGPRELIVYPKNRDFCVHGGEFEFPLLIKIFTETDAEAERVRSAGYIMGAIVALRGVPDFADRSIEVVDTDSLLYPLTLKVGEKGTHFEIDFGD